MDTLVLTDRQQFSLLEAVRDGAAGDGRFRALLDDGSVLIEVSGFCEADYHTIAGDYYQESETWEIGRCGFIDRIQADRITEEGIEACRLEAAVVEAIEEILNTPQ